MKKILFLILAAFTFTAASAQVPWSVSGVKTRFTKGLGVPVIDTAMAGAADTAQILIRPQDGLLYYKHTGGWVLAASSAFYVPYTGATGNVTIGEHRVSARTLLMDSLWARGSGGAVAVTNSGTRSFSWGAGGSSEVTFYGFAGYDANRAGSYTARSFTDKNYVDSSAALRKAIADTFFTGGYTTRARTKQQIDSLSNAVSNGFVTIATNQDVTGRKSFTQNQIWFSTSQSGQTVGGNSSGIFFGNTNTIGGTQNVVLGFESTASGNQGIAIGNNARAGSSTANNNIAIGQKASEFITSGSFNISIGRRAANGLSTGSNNISIGDAAGYLSGTFPFALSTNTKSIFLGNNTRGLVDGGTNEIVIGDSVLGNGSNTVTIGNSSVTDNYFSGYLRQTGFTSALAKAGSTGRLEAAVAGTDYVVPSALSGTTNYLPKFTGSNSIGNSNLINDANGRLGVGVSPAPQNSGALLGSTEVGGILRIQGGTGRYFTSGDGMEISKTSIYSYNRGTNAYNDININDAITVKGGGNTLIKTTTDNGTDALQVAGSGLFTGAVTASGGKPQLYVSGNSVSGAGVVLSTLLSGSDRRNWFIGTEENVAGDFVIKSSTVAGGNPNSGDTRFSILKTGEATFSSSVTATGFFESSDLRLKNIVKRDGDVVYFNWKNGQDKKLHIGYIAQEVQKTNPDQVKKDENGYLSVNYTEVLVQKVRELEKQIAELQNRIK